MQANLDYQKGYLITPSTKLKLLFQNTKHECYSINVAPRVEQIIKVKTYVYYLLKIPSSIQVFYANRLNVGFGILGDF